MKPIFVAGLFGMMMATSQGAETALKDAFKNDFRIGAALNPAQFSEANAAEAALVKRQFNSITPENVLKWGLVHPALGRFDFAPADRYVEFGVQNKMFIVGHTLIWHAQTPDWVFQDDQGRPLDRDALLARMREHIFAVAGRYRGKIGGWDVVNEALAEDGRLRESPWKKIIGDDYLLKAYQFAHEADPAAELYYNEFNLEHAAKRAGAVALIQQLQAQGVPIAAVGLQGHYKLDWPSTNEISETIEAFATLGVKVMITELDVDVLPAATKRTGAEVSLNLAPQAHLNPYTNGLPETVQRQLTQRYADLFTVFLQHRDQINRVTFWGVADGDSWLNNWPVRGRTSYPLVFDRNCQPKPAFQAIIGTAPTKRPRASE